MDKVQVQSNKDTGSLKSVVYILKVNEIHVQKRRIAYFHPRIHIQ